MSLTERVVNAVAAQEETPRGCTSTILAKELEVGRWKVLQVLQQMEAMGCVYRTGAKRGTRWWLA